MYLDVLVVNKPTANLMYVYRGVAAMAQFSDRCMCRDSSDNQQKPELQHNFCQWPLHY